MAAAPLALAPLGANLAGGGATFRTWAPRATSVSVIGSFNNWNATTNPLASVGGGQWAAFVPGVKDGDEYLFRIQGPAGTGNKRDPRARLLSFQPPFPASNCVVRSAGAFPWHDSGYRPPNFSDLVIYQLHIGTFHVDPANAGGKFLDVATHIPHLASLGINALQLMPIVEFPSTFSLGYNGVDYFSPENDYGDEHAPDVLKYFNALNGLLAARGATPYASVSQVTGSDHQLRALIDVCHVYGIAVLLDVVYNHAGGGFDSQSLYFYDRLPQGNQNDSLYFTDQGWAGGLVFAFWNGDVRDFLEDNATFFTAEYHADGLRYDEVSVMDRFGGWSTAQQITSAVRAEKPSAIQIAEYWPVNPFVVRPSSQGGAGFDATWSDKLRDSVRAALSQASGGAAAGVDLGRIADAMNYADTGARWRLVNCLENHDIVKFDREDRVPRLADPSNSRSWYARSRARWATALLLTAPGIPMLFMGEEILEDRRWSDDPQAGGIPNWPAFHAGNKILDDFLRFVRELLAVRAAQPALRGEGLNVFHVHNANRVLAFQRWVEGQGNDVVIVASLNESTYYNYDLGFPAQGQWREVFNSDVHDNWVNPQTAGNGGAVIASGPPRHGLPTSANIVIPANALLVFAR